jgi:hypothetical protein
MGAGASPGLQIQWQPPEGGCGGFDSLTPPPSFIFVPVTHARAGSDTRYQTESDIEYAA